MYCLIVLLCKNVKGVPSARGLGLLDLDFEHSTVSPILLRLMGIWQKRLGNWARWWNTERPISLRNGPQITINHIHEQMGQLVLSSKFTFDQRTCGISAPAFMTIGGTGAMGGMGIGGSQAGDLLDENKWFLIGSRIFLCAGTSCG